MLELCKLVNFKSCIKLLFKNSKFTQIEQQIFELIFLNYQQVIVSFKN